MTDAANETITEMETEMQPNNRISIIYRLFFVYFDSHYSRLISDIVKGKRAKLHNRNASK